MRGASHVLPLQQRESGVIPATSINTQLVALTAHCSRLSLQGRRKGRLGGVGDFIHFLYKVLGKRSV